MHHTVRACGAPGHGRDITEQIKRELRRRSAVAPVIGASKDGHRPQQGRASVGCKHLAGRRGDVINAIMATVGYDVRRILASTAAPSCARRRMQAIFVPIEARSFHRSR
ncbi:MAG TPA: hypothetical protein VK726_10445 [Acetobacteraceae bacterium]|jgi:hypothetical protein|nr:hypothetical protein [Acetobacteraceae bacterium]